MIEIQEGKEFERQQEIADENISKILNPKNNYQRIQEDILRSIFE
jgi:hypothetical protein